MGHFTFHADEHGCIRVQLGDEPDDSDPTIGSTASSNRGWAAKLVEQANRLDPPPPWMMDTASAVVWASRNPNDRFKLLLNAARSLLEVWDEEHEGSADLRESLSFQILQLADAVQAWER